MHQFSIHAPDGEHLGFLVMLADDETAPHPESGQLALQIQPAAKNTALARLAQAQTLYWQAAGDHVRIRDKTATTAPTSAKNGSSSAANTTNSTT